MEVERAGEFCKREKRGLSKRFGSGVAGRSSAAGSMVVVEVCW
jgi:hypothetical protein